MSFGKYHNAMINYGLTDEEYAEIRESIVDSNFKNMNILGGFGIVLMLVLGVATILTSDRIDYIVYFACAFLSTIAWVCNWLFTKKNNHLLKFWVYILVMSYMGAGLAFGIWIDGNRPAVSYVCYMILLPIIFSDRPFRIAITEAIWIIGYITLAFIFKEGDALYVDVVNIAFFGIVSIVVTLFLGKRRVDGFYNAYRVHMLAHIDILTGTRNRNFYEEMLRSYPLTIKKSIACVYMDVNGLHDLNNNQGHDAGDKMLKRISQITIEHIGKDYVYRTGGDEFVGFIIDMEQTEVDTIVEGILNDIFESGYHVAIGVVYSTKEELNMTQTVTKAEQLMYKNKAEFYKTTGGVRPRVMAGEYSEGE